VPRPSVEAERREQILDAACDVIARSGVANLRMADIAKVAKEEKWKADRDWS